VSECELLLLLLLTNYLFWIVFKGAVIVGSLDGNRIWGKELRSLTLACVEVRKKLVCQAFFCQSFLYVCLFGC